jgi:hypothetical protein
VNVDPDLDRLRTDPRFAAIVQGVFSSAGARQ